MACAVETPISMVWPSVALAVTSAASVFEAPGLFSTTTVWPHIGVSLSATARAIWSVPPPGEAPTSNLTGLVGHSCASAGAPIDTARPSIKVLISFIFTGVS